MYNSLIKNARKHSYKTPCKVLFLIFVSSCLILFNVQLMAQGNLLIGTPRVIFDGQKRVINVDLANTGIDSAKYNISFIQIRMTEDGKFQEITTPDPGQNFADKNVRFFPRSVMLGPKESQIIKLQMIKGEQLEEGEYRSHLYFRSLPNQKKLGDDDIKPDSAGITIKIVPIYGISIPVIIRVGASTTNVTLSDIKLETTAEGNSSMLLSIHRTGNMSVYGDISIIYTAPDKKETTIGMFSGIAVYTPNAIRNIKFDLENKSSIDLSKGTIRVMFSSLTNKRSEKLAEAELIR